MARPKKIRRQTVGEIVQALIEIATAKEKHRIYSGDMNDQLDAEDAATQERYRVEINHRVDALLNLADD